MRARDVTIDWLRERLSGWEGTSGQYYAWCPCHDDEGTSVKGLSITERGGRILAKCHSPQCGATLTDVISVLEGWDETEEEIPDVRVTRKTKGSPGLAAWVHYTQVEAGIWDMLGCLDHGEGTVRFTFAETDVVKIRQVSPKAMHFEPKGAEISPLWPIPHDELPEHISITEGESDCGTTYAADLPPGFSVTKGADTPLFVATFQALASRGVREITIYADTDLAGSEFKDRCVSLAIDAGLACNVCDLTRIVDPFHPHKDLNSLWKAVDNTEQFLELVERATVAVAKGREYMSIEETLTTAEEDVHWIIDHLLAPRDKVLIWGPPKAYKTWIVLDLIRSLTACRPFLMRDEWTPKENQRVLLVEEEGNLQLFARRVKRLQIPVDSPLMLLHRKSIKFTDPESIAYIISVCREYEVDVVVFDPLQRMIPGVNENDAAEMGIVWDQIQRLQDACEGLACVVVHHGSKSETGGWSSSRGSSRHGGEVDLGIHMQKHQTEDNAVSIWMDGRETHANLEPNASFMGKIEITEDTFSIDARDVEVQVHKTKRDSTRDDNKTAILIAVKKGCDTRTKIKMETNLSDNTVIEHLKALVSEGMLTETPAESKNKPNTYAYVEEE